MTTLCLQHTSLDPYFNLAAEEYFLKNFTEDLFIIWRSEPSIVVGKHQNALAEINHAFVKENNIFVARRLSGGGTVFHDPGNLNFTFIKTVKEVSEVNFKTFTEPVVKALKKRGIEAYTTGRNDLMVGGKKISGNAEHVFKKRVLHHGTLLFNSNLGKLKGALKVDLSRFEDKSVQSNRSPVCNIAGHLQKEMSIAEFSDYLFAEVQTHFQDRKVYGFSEKDVETIQQLANEKYATWDWIYGYSPKYVFRNKIKTEGKQIDIELKVIKGIIKEAKFEGLDSGSKLQSKFTGKRHRIEEIETLLKENNTDLLKEGVAHKIFLNALF